MRLEFLLSIYNFYVYFFHWMWYNSIKLKNAPTRGFEMLTPIECTNRINRHINHATSVVGYDIYSVAKYINYLETLEYNVSREEVMDIMITISNGGGTQNWEN